MPVASRVPDRYPNPAGPNLTRYEHIASALASAGITEQETTPEVSREIAAEQVRLLYRQVPSALLATVLVSVAMAAALWDVVPRTVRSSCGSD